MVCIFFSLQNNVGLMPEPVGVYLAAVCCAGLGSGSGRGRGASRARRARPRRPPPWPSALQPSPERATQHPEHAGKARHMASEASDTQSPDARPHSHTAVVGEAYPPGARLPVCTAGQPQGRAGQDRARGQRAGQAPVAVGRMAVAVQWSPPPSIATGPMRKNKRP